MDVFCLRAEAVRNESLAVPGGWSGAVQSNPSTMTLGVRRQVKTWKFGDIEMSKYVDVCLAWAYMVLNLGLLDTYRSTSA